MTKMCKRERERVRGREKEREIDQSTVKQPERERENVERRMQYQMCSEAAIANDVQLSVHVTAFDHKFRHILFPSASHSIQSQHSYSRVPKYDR